MMNVNKLLGSTSGLKLRSSLIVVATILVCSVGAGAQQWKDALKAEKAKNGQRQDAINTQGAPIAASLRKVTAQIETHNANRCTFPKGHPEACAAYEKEAARLNTYQQRLRSQLQPLVDEFDRLTARNEEIERRLKCVPLPTSCKSDSDCNECSSCSTFDGRGKAGVCQPLP